MKAAAAKAKLELIPAVFSIGYSNGLLAHDPNLAEGLPVIDQPYVVKDGVAVLDSCPAARSKRRLRAIAQRQVPASSIAGRPRP